MPTPTTERPPIDRCPGVLRPYDSGDGALVRLRTPGGRLGSAALLSLLRYAAEHGAPVLQLTSRGNLQLRGLPLPLPADLESFVADVGLMPSATHEVMRNVIASPFSAPMGELAVTYDAALRADPASAGLPGRWLVAFDDGSGDVLGEPFDLAYQARSDSAGWLLLAGGFGRAVSRDEVVPALIELGQAFLRDRAASEATVWNVRDLGSDAEVFRGMDVQVLSGALRNDGAPAAGAEVQVLSPRIGQPPRLGQHGDDLLVGVPLGMLELGQAEAIAQHCAEVVLTPWRSILLRGVVGAGPGGAVGAEPGGTDGAEAALRADGALRGDPEGALRAAGLVLDDNAGLARVTACVGAPHCARTSVPTLQIARELAASDAMTQRPAVHVSGCDRRCGHSARAVDVIAPADASDALVQLGAGR